MTGLLIFSIYVSFSNEWATHAQAPQQPLFLNCSQCRRWPKVPLELFQKTEALTQGWPFLKALPFFKALALLQGFQFFLLLPFLATSTQLPSSSFTSGAAFGSGLPLFLGLAPFGPPCLCLVVGKGWTAHCWSCWCCCFAGSALSRGLLFALFQGLLPALSQCLLLALSQGHSSDPWVVLAREIWEVYLTIEKRYNEKTR